MALGDEDEDAGILQLRSEVRGVTLLGMPGCRDEAGRIELVVGPNQERAEPAE